MKKMIVSAAVVFAVVSGALAFKNPSNKAFECQTQGSTSTCVLITSNVSTGTNHQLQNPGIITTTNLAGQDCSVSSSKPCNLKPGGVFIKYNIEGE